MKDRFLGFVGRDGARYGGTVAVFETAEGNRPVFDVLSLLIRHHNLAAGGRNHAEEDRAIADFRRCLDSQHWHDASKDFDEWLSEHAKEPHE